MMWRIFSAMVLLALVWAPASADTIWTGSGQLKIAGAKIKQIQGTVLYYEVNGREVSRELGQIARLEADGENTLNSAEEAFYREQWSDAADGYLKSVRATNKEWLGKWSAVRLVESANKAGRLDAAVTGYLSLLTNDAEVAAKYKPAIPDQSSFLDSAIKEVEARLNDAKLKHDARRSLSAFALELYRAKKDDDKVGEMLSKLAGSGDMPADAQVQLKLSAAKVALDRKQYAEAIQTIEPSRALFIEPAQQADALFILAEAKSGLAKPSDKTALKDAALAYMRVVAHFANLEGKPHVAQSLLRTAEIYQQLGESQTALRLYERIATEFPSDPAGRQAKQQADSLKATTRPS